ncbi:MAG: N-acetyltransferase, partial [Desulfobacula sp.]
MNHPRITIRLMNERDFDDVIRIDQKILNVSRLDYYTLKFELLFKSGEYLPTSLVAEDENKNLVGFIMGELYIGEFGISREGASIDTVGVDPDFQRQGIGKKLMNEFLDHLK